MRGRLLAMLLIGLTGCRAPAEPVAAVDYGAASSWICRPGVDDGTCSADLGALAIDAAGTRTFVPFVAAVAPPIDCFYVYPTASGDAGLYSDMSPDGSEKHAVHGQAARLAARCRLFVPAYRQLTGAGLGQTLAAHAEAGPLIEGRPYGDVRAAWRSYLAHDNHGRGVVLVGHSQGAMILKKLIAEEIDGKPASRLLVAAYLAGNPNLGTASFRAIPPCAAADQTGCIVAWSSYGEGYDGTRTFGGAKQGKAICVNPAAPGGGRGMLKPFLLRPGMAPASDPPFVEAVGQISAECVADGKGTVLRLRVEPGRYADLLSAALAHAMPDPEWGLHTLDINLAQGNMLDLIAGQSAAWVRHHPS